MEDDHKLSNLVSILKGGFMNLEDISPIEKT